METEKFNQLKQIASKGDKKAFAVLYGEVYRELFYIAFYSLKDEGDAVFAVKETVIDAYAAFFSAINVKNSEDFRFWILKILCSKIKKQFKAYARTNTQISYDKRCEKLNADGIDIKQEFNSLPEIDRLVLSIEILCGYNAEKIARLIDFSPETVEIRIANAEIVLRERILNLNANV